MRDLRGRLSKLSQPPPEPARTAERIARDQGEPNTTGPLK